tara:strand:- start:662 stop:1339 length:678 start_codon:yes stop_codon:yes gene_type:complete
MHKKLSIATIDTETIGLQPKNFVYDIGVTFHDKCGAIAGTYTALVEEIWCDPKLMMGAFYAGKVFTHYSRMLETGGISIRPWQSIIDDLQGIIEAYDVNVVSAYNLGFDMGAIKRTSARLGAGPLLPHPRFKLLDIWRFACETILQQSNFRQLAMANGWRSEKGNFKTTAEIAYRYITRELGFAESHTALDDSKIETDILAKCFRQKRAIPYGAPIRNPWKLAQA